MDVVIGHGLRDAERAAAAALYWEAFRGKLGRALGPEETALRFLAPALRIDRVFVARGADGALLGLAGYKDGDGAFVGGGIGALAAVYGWFGALWRLALLAVLERPAPAGTLVMDGIVVAEKARGLGVGSALIAAVEAHAAAGGQRTLRLDVIDSNPRAEALYRRLGFEPAAQRHLGPLAPVFGFRSATTLTKALP